jgi:dienelactone hydrolase
MPTAIPCPNCLTGFVKDGTPTGVVATVHGLITYVAKPEGKPKGVIVFLPDMFGWEMVNARLLADIYAKQGGYLVYLPNIMNGQ